MEQVSILYTLYSVLPVNRVEKSRIYCQIIFLEKCLFINSNYNSSEKNSHHYIYTLTL